MYCLDFRAVASYKSLFIRPMRRLASIVVLLALAASCGRKKAPPSPESPAAVKGLGAVPAEANVILRFDIERLRDSPVFRQAVSYLLAADLDDKSKLDALLAKCHFDPSRDLRSVLLAFVGPKALLVAEGKFDEATLSECVGGLASERGGALAKKTVAGAAAYVAHGAEPEETWFAFVGKETVLVAENEDLLTRARDPAAAKVTGAAAKTALLAKADQKRPIWGVGTVPPSLGEAFVAVTEGAVKHPPAAVTGWAEMADGLQLEVTFAFADAVDAQALVEFAKKQLEALEIMAQMAGLEGVVKRIKVEPSDKIVRVSLALDKRELEDLAQRLEAGSDEPADDQEPIDMKEGNSHEH